MQWIAGLKNTDVCLLLSVDNAAERMSQSKLSCGNSSSRKMIGRAFSPEEESGLRKKDVMKVWIMIDEILAYFLILSCGNSM